MFGFLFRRAQATVDRAVDHIVHRIIIAIPFLIAGGFGTAALALRLNREYGPEITSLILAGGFAALGLLAVLAYHSSEGPSETAGATEEPAQASASAGAQGPDLSNTDRELIMAALTSAAPLALPALVRTVGRNLPLLAAVAAAAFIISRDGHSGAALEPGE